MDNIVVIIPTYNEEENIGKMLDLLVKEEFPQIKNHKMKILVVDDHSPDGTGKLIRQKMNEYNQGAVKNIEILEGEKQGLGKAFARGMKYAIKKMSADAVIEMDADFQHNPKDVKRLVSEYDRGYDYVIGSRYAKGGSIPKEWHARRKFLSWAGNIFARFVLLIFKVKDVTSGFKLTRVKGFLDKIDLDHLLSYDYAYKINILYDLVKDYRAKVKEVPIDFHYRERGSSKMETTDIKESLKVVIILFFKSRFFKFAIVGFIGFLINAVGLEAFRRVPYFEHVAANFSSLYGSNFGFIAQPSAWAAAAATELSIISNFILNNYWTFSKEKISGIGRIVKKFVDFNATSAGAIVIQFVVIGLAVHLIKDTVLVRQGALVIAVVFFVVPYNYTMYNVFIWKRWHIAWLPFLDKKN